MVVYARCERRGGYYKPKANKTGVWRLRNFFYKFDVNQASIQAKYGIILFHSEAVVTKLATLTDFYCEYVNKASLFCKRLCERALVVSITLRENEPSYENQTLNKNIRSLSINKNVTSIHTKIV